MEDAAEHQRRSEDVQGGKGLIENDIAEQQGAGRPEHAHHRRPLRPDPGDTAGDHEGGQHGAADCQQNT